MKGFRLKPEPDLPASTTILGDWYANLLNFGPQRYVLCLSEHSFFPVILPARNSEFPVQLASYVHPLLLAAGVPAVQALREAQGMAEFKVGKTASRTALGVMNDFSISATWAFGHDDLFGISLWLSETPSGPLKYASPKDRTLQLFSEAMSG